MATSTNYQQQRQKVLQHPSHQHPLELRNGFSNDRGNPSCGICSRKIWGNNAYYSCQEVCGDTDSYYHRACAEAPPRIDQHPLHPEHPLNLIHGIRSFVCRDCKDDFTSVSSLFRCVDCDFDLDVGCALSTLSDEGNPNSQGGKISERISPPIHTHQLTSFSTRHEFVAHTNCYVCRKSVEGDGYMCLNWWCEFIIHKRCIQDLCYADGTKATTVYHEHTMEILAGEEHTTCASCGSDKPGEFIGCGNCRVFYHRQCFQVPEILTHPSHDQDHALVLFPDMVSRTRCESCAGSLEHEIYYRCTSCDFSVHVGCAVQVLAYAEQGMSGKIKLPWHKHPLLLCDRAKRTSHGCSYCYENSEGPMYVCENKVDCGILLHKRCTEFESPLTHPHHPDHPLILHERDDDDRYFCRACGETPKMVMLSCEQCLFGLHVECAALFPTHKHYLHEHELLHLERHPNAKCKRCCRRTDSPLFRCVPCDFNLHDECMELPRVVKSKIHWHPVTLQKIFLEDDSGEYYCEECEQPRDPRLGVYVCGQCEISIPRIYHIHCVLPELAKVYAKDEQKESFVFSVEKLNAQIGDKREEVRTIEEKLVEAKRELDVLVKKRTKLLREEAKFSNSYDSDESD